MYGLPTPELFHIDDLLDLSNEELFSSASIATVTATTTNPSDQTTFTYASASSSSSPSVATTFPPSFSTDFPHDLCLPNDDVAQLEWLSQFVEDSFTDFPSNSLVGTFNPINGQSPTSSFSSKARTKRSRAPATTLTTMSEAAAAMLTGKSKAKKEIQRQAASPAEDGSVVRRCTHCASEKTPQWRTGPLGPKTLCNACGVRYKSGRLVPEYRPAASPTFVLTQHSNSHRKVMELRRQKEVVQQQQQEEQVYRHHQHHRRQPHDFEVC